jgi:hypothetical protein
MQITLLLIPALAIDCSNSDTLCLENTVVPINQPTTVFLAATQIPASQPRLELRLYTGDLSIDAPADPCNINRTPSAIFPVSTISPLNTYLSTTLITFDETVRPILGQPVFLQFWTSAGNCQLGPRTAGNNETFFVLAEGSSGAISTASPVQTSTTGFPGEGESGNPTDSINPNNQTPSGPSNTYDGNSSTTLLWVAIGSGIFLIILLIAMGIYFLKKRTLQTAKSDHRTSLDMLVDTEAAFASFPSPPLTVTAPSNNAESPTSASVSINGAALNRSSRIVSRSTFISTISRKDAEAIGEAFKDALANPNWESADTL